MSHGGVSVRMMSHKCGKYESEWSKCGKQRKESVWIVTICKHERWRSALLCNRSQQPRAGRGASSLPLYLPFHRLAHYPIFLDCHQWGLPLASCWYCWFYPPHWQGWMSQCHHHEPIWVWQVYKWCCSLTLSASQAFEFEAPRARHLPFYQQRVVSNSAMSIWFQISFILCVWPALHITLSIYGMTPWHRVPWIIPSLGKFGSELAILCAAENSSDAPFAETKWSTFPLEGDFEIPVACAEDIVTSLPFWSWTTYSEFITQIMETVCVCDGWTQDWTSAFTSVRAILCCITTGSMLMPCGPQESIVPVLSCSIYSSPPWKRRISR